MKTFRFIPAVALAFICNSCAGLGDGSPGNSNTVPVATTGASTVGGSQGTAQAAETGSATNTVSPSIVNLFGARTVKITRTPQGETIEAEGQEDAQVEIGTANMGVRFGNEGLRAETSSGGSGVSGAGNSARPSTNTTTGTVPQ